MVVGSPVSGLIRGYVGLSDWLELGMGDWVIGGVLVDVPWDELGVVAWLSCDCLSHVIV